VQEVTADTDGTFYSRPEPGAPDFVAEGDEVARAATLGLVEVMKTFSPVRAPVAGVVVKVLVGDGEAVRAGQALMWIGSQG
jgi:acetyl-CoA carboxylase biotin carboxyl carrier protein